MKPNHLSEFQQMLHISSIVVMAVGFLILDSTTSLGIAEGILYLLVVLATLPLQNKYLTLAAMAVSTIFTVLGFMASPPGMHDFYAFVNRGLSVLSVWVTGFMVLKYIASSQKLYTLKEELQQQFDLQTIELKQQNQAMHALLGEKEIIQHALEEKEARLKLFIDAFPSGMVMVNENGKITLLNRIVETLFGYTKNELLGQPIERLIPDRYRKAHFRHRADYTDNPSPRGMGAGRDLYARKKDGTEFPVEIGLNPLKTDEGTYVLASLIDISERKTAEATLERQTRLLALDAELGRIMTQTEDLQPLLKSCAQAICEQLDAVFACIWLSNPTQQLFDIHASAGLVTDLDGPYLCGPDGQGHISHIAETKKPYLTNALIGDPRFPKHDWASRERVVAFAGYPLLRGQDVLGVMEIYSRNSLPESIFDTLSLAADRIAVATDRYQIRQAHYELSQRNQRILNAAGEGIYEIDLNGRTTFINPAGARMLGYEPQELIGVCMHALVHHTKPDGSPYPEQECRIHTSLKSGSFERIADEVLWRKDGTAFPAEYISTPLQNENHQLCGAVVVFNDITERKQSEQIIAERNQELMRSNEELDQFAYIASHDLKEPLRGIHNFSKILVEDYAQELNEDAMEKCETLIRLSRRMEDLVDSLLYFSRVGRTELAMRPTNLDEMFHNLLDSLQGLIRENHAEIICPEPLPTLYCDSVRTGEIFQNLIVNALKYNDKDKKRVEIGCFESGEALHAERHIEPGTHVFYVKDNGIGIREKHYKSIFRIFKRLHARDKYGGGSGVGMTITKKLVERHGGEIWVESTVGEGTTFYFTLGRTIYDRNPQPAHSLSRG